MYEHFRTEFLSELAEHLISVDMDKVVECLDKVASNYDVTDKPTALMVRDNLYPKELKIYLSTLILEGKSEKTVKLYSDRLKIFFRNVNKLLDTIEGNDIRLFLAEYQQTRKISPNSLEKDRQILSIFFKWCVAEEYLSKNPCANIKPIKCEDKHRNPLTRLQLEKLRSCCETKLERAIVEVLYSTGVRVSELCNMKRSQIDTVNKSITVLGKGKKNNTVYFNEASQFALDEYDDSRTDKSDWLFYCENTNNHISVSGVERLFQDFSERCGFYVCPHIMRHTFATLSLQAGMPIDIVQKSLAHSSVATTQRYAKTIQDDVQSAHRKYVI